MSETLHINQMPMGEKLRVMEARWDYLCRNEEAVPIHQWQKDLLDERERLVKEGKAQFVDWETAKKRIAERIS